MMLNPFPFGNTNGIIDMVTLGLVGICKTGPEVHEHIDEGLFNRLGLPQWLISDTVDEYVERALRLIENHEERLQLRRQIIKNNGLQTLFRGDPTPMGKVLLEKFNQWEVDNLVKDEKKVEDSKPKKTTKAKSTATKTTKTTKTTAKTTAKKTVKKTTKKAENN